MSGTMMAARWIGRREISMETVPVPVPAADEALVAVDWVGLCGSDVEEFLEGPIVISPPVTLGHELVGTVSAAAADGSGPPVGARVVVDVVTGCGRCFWCLRHEEGLCADLVVIGQHVDGGLAEYVAARANRLIVLPDALDSRLAVIAEPLSVAVRAVRKAGPLQGSGVLIVGGGAVGMLTAQVALRAGASPVAVIEPSPARRALLERWGAVALWAPDEAGRRSAVDAVMPPRGVDVVIESSGRPGMTTEAVRLTRRGGTALLLSVLPELEPVDTLDLVLGEKTVRGSAAHLWDDDVAVAVDMLARGVVDVAPMITGSFPLEATQAAFETLSRPEDGNIKTIVRVGAPAPDDAETRK